MSDPSTPSARLRQMAAAMQLDIQDRLQTAHADYLLRLSQVCEEEFTRFLDQSEPLLTPPAPARNPVLERLNQAARRMRRAPHRDQWTQALLDAATIACTRAALFAIEHGVAQLLGSRGDLPGDARERLQQQPVPLPEAPALVSVLETKETVVALSSDRELSSRIAALLPSREGAKVYLVPILRDETVVAILLAESETTPVEVNALELLAAVGGNLTERAPIDEEYPVEDIESQEEDRSGLVQISGIALAPPKALAPDPTPSVDHSARRFAATEIARLLLNRPAEVAWGRATHDLYGSLQAPFETLRSLYRQNYLTNSRASADYLHEEFLRTLAHDDPSLLGPGYPGPLA